MERVIAGLVGGDEICNETKEGKSNCAKAGCNKEIRLLFGANWKETSWLQPSSHNERVGNRKQGEGDNSAREWR